MTGMQQFDDACKKKYQSKFVKCTPQQREEFLIAIEAKTDISEEVADFYKSIKRLTIQSFTTSEEYLTKVKNYSLIPAKYKGCVPMASV